MSKILTDIQTATRIYARDGDLTLTSGDGLVSVNRLYRELALILPWSEFRRQDTSLTTTAGTGAYTWPTTPIFSKVTALEVQDLDDQSRYKLVFPPTDEWTWNESENKKSQSVPDHYMRVSTSTAQQIEFRPTPKYSSKIIRITGKVEPTPLTGAYSVTDFITTIADDAFEYIIAASWTDRDGDTQWTQRLLEKSTLLLRGIFDQDLVTDDLLRRVIQS